MSRNPCKCRENILRKVSHQVKNNNHNKRCVKSCVFDQIVFIYCGKHRRMTPNKKCVAFKNPRDNINNNFHQSPHSLTARCNADAKNTMKSHKFAWYCLRLAPIFLVILYLCMMRWWGAALSLWKCYTTQADKQTQSFRAIFRQYIEWKHIFFCFASNK